MYKKDFRNRLINDILFERGEIIYEASGPLVDKDEFVDLKYYTNDEVRRGRKHKSAGLPLSQRFYHWGTRWEDELCIFWMEPYTKEGKLKQSANTITGHDISKEVRRGVIQYCAGKTDGNGVLFFLAHGNMQDTVKLNNALQFFKREANNPNIVIEDIRTSIPVEIVDKNNRAYIPLKEYEDTVFDYIMKDHYRRVLNANLPEKYKKTYAPRKFRFRLNEAKLSKKTLAEMPSLEDYGKMQRKKIYNIIKRICSKPEHKNDRYYTLFIPRMPDVIKDLTPEALEIYNHGTKVRNYFVKNNIDDEITIEREIDKFIDKLKSVDEKKRIERERQEEMDFIKQNYHTSGDKIDSVRISDRYIKVASQIYRVCDNINECETADNIAVYVAGQFCTINNEEDKNTILAVIQAFRKALKSTNNRYIDLSFNDWTYESDGYKNMLHARYQQGLEMFWPYSVWNA